MKELDVICLTKEFKGLPIGTEVTIVHEYDGKAFEVEFFDNEVIRLMSLLHLLKCSNFS